MWLFKKLTEGDLERNPHEAEFFNVGDIDKSASLVREVIQNSLDAKLSTDKPIRVRFAFGKHKKSKDDIYYDELIKHIKSSGLLPQEYTTCDYISFLTIEDFETTGLDGPVTREEMSKAGGSNYYNFWWREGISQKEGKKMGRWGLGKTAFHVASDLRSFWGLTVRHDDKRTLLLGKSLLETHKYNGKIYDYCGFFAGKGYVPIEKGEVLNNFCDRFAVTRKRNSGLSIVLPMPSPEVNYDGIVRSVIIYYFFPIIKGMLEVEISHDSSTTVLDASSLREIALKQDWSNSPWEDRPVESLMEFLEDAVTMPEGKKIKLQMPKGVPKITESLFGEKLSQLQERFSAKELMFIHVPIRIHPKGHSEGNSHFEVFLQRDDTLSKPDEFYVRGGITISEIKKLGNRRVRALLSAQDEAVCTFLGDCESPAHTDWKERIERFLEKYHDARATLRFIKSSIAEIVRILDQPPLGVVHDLLQDIFYIPEIIDEEDVDIVKPKIKLPPPKPQVFDVSRIEGGFRVILANKDAKLPSTAVVRMAYDMRRGNPFSNYHPMDFDVSNGAMEVVIADGKIVEKIKNSLTVSIIKPDFELRVTGFDSKRDVIVDVREEVK